VSAAPQGIDTVSGLLRKISKENKKALYGQLTHSHHSSFVTVYNLVKDVVDPTVAAILDSGEKILVDFVDQGTFIEKVKEKEKEKEYRILLKTIVGEYNRSHVETFIAFGTCDC
jgi:hypothetical protein